MSTYEDMRAYEDSVSKLVDELKEAGTPLRMHKIRCVNCHRFLATAPYENIHFLNLLCVECTVECIDTLASEADD